MSLENCYRKEGLICIHCDKPYVNPLTYPPQKITTCANCWKSFSPNEKNLWGNTTIADRIRQIELCWNHENGYINDDDQDWQNELILREVKSANWNKVREKLENIGKRKWNNMSAHILVEACEHSNVPKDIIELLLDSGVNQYVTRPCLNPGGIGAMTPVAVAAEKGTIGALRVFNERNMYGITYLDWAASCAVMCGQAEALDIIWSQSRSYNNGYGEVTEKLCNRAQTGRIIEHAKENGYVGIVHVVQKYFPI